MRKITLFILALSGAAMAFPGVYLLMIGGSAYYLLAGAAMLASAELVRRRRDTGVYLYWLFLLITAVWSVSEVGFDGWALMPRLAFLLVLGFCLVPFLSRHKARIAAAAAIGMTVICVGVVSVRTDAAASYRALKQPTRGGEIRAGEWASYGSTIYGTRYSSLSQINAGNVSTLGEAWVYHMSGSAGRKTGGLEVTPLMTDGKVFGCTGYSDVFALDPVSGREIWRTNARLNERAIGHTVCRGVSYYRAPAAQIECPTRVLVGSADNKLVALDAETGKACRSFGANGSLDLADGLGKVPNGWTNPTSPPTIIRGTVVVGAFIVDNQSTSAPSGVVRGYDAVTGHLKWVFDPSSEDGRGAALHGKIFAPGSPNSWAPASADPALGLVYLPMGNGSPDFYGANRTAATDRFSSAIVALDADTGQVRWVFQTVHHDLWDYDLAAQPVLVDFPTANGPVPALIQATKTGQIFVLDRRTGAALSKVEEKPALASTIPAERWSHTQPYSTGMPDFAGPALKESDMWGISPFDQLFCRIRFHQARYQGMYTPLGLGYSLRLPGELGGIDWGGVSVDERNAIMIVNSNRMADLDQLISRKDANSEGLYARDGTRPGYQPHGAPGAAMAGTPYAVRWGVFTTWLGIPCQKPPYGFLTAVDLRTRSILWQRKFGDASNSGPFGLALGLPFGLGAPNIGGSIVTGGGLVFIGASQDKGFRAVSEVDGRVLWKVRLPAGGHATPMTYMGRDRRQYVLIAAGGNQSFGTGQADSLIAYRLKK